MIACWEAAVRSKVETPIRQGNVLRLGPDSGPTAAGTGEDVGSLSGLRRFCTSMDSAIDFVEHLLPLVVARP